MRDDAALPPYTPLRTGDRGTDSAARLALLVNNDAEQALIGAILIRNGVYARVAEIVGPGDFAFDVHGRIFAAAGKLIETGQNANPVTLKSLFDGDTALADIGGGKYLARLAISAVTVINAVDYAQVVADLARRRELIAIGEDIVSDAANLVQDRGPLDIVSAFRGRIDGVGKSAANLGSGFAIDPASLEGAPIRQRQWLVPDWIPIGRATSLYGAGGEGKTLLAQMLATACAIGQSWLGLPVRQCNSLLLFCEDDIDEMHRRQADINAHYGCGFADLGAMRWLPRLGEDNALMSFDADGLARRTLLFDRFLAAAKGHHAQLVITDTLADVFTGNENDRAQARQFGQAILGHIARETGAASLTLAHPSLNGAANGSTGSGSTAWKGTFRSQLYIESPDAAEGEQQDPDMRVLRRAKANYARRDETIEMRWVQGVFVPLHAATGIIASIERRTCERVFLDLLARIAAEGRYVCENVHAQNYAPKIFAMRPDRERFRIADFAVAMQALFARRLIRNETFKGNDRHIYSRITIIEGESSSG